MKTYILSLFSLAVLAALLWYSYSRPAPLSPEAVHQEGTYYTIDATYPRTTGLSPSANASAVGLMKTFVDESVNQFKTDGNVTDPALQEVHKTAFEEGYKLALDIGYEEKRSAHTLSYIYTVYEDTGGAHPNHYEKTFTFDTTTGKALALGDLFKSSDYLKVISVRARADLPKIFKSMSGDEVDMGFWAQGTEPVAENFQSFYFDGTDLIFLFSPYAVAPYVYGTITLPIPASDLKNILNPQYP